MSAGPNPWAESNQAARRARAAAERLADALDRNLVGQPHAPLEPLQAAYAGADADAERLRAQASADAEESEPWAAAWAANSAGRDALAALPEAAADAGEHALAAAAAAEGVAAALPLRSTGMRGALTRAATFARQAAARAHVRVGRSVRPEVVLSPAPPAGAAPVRVEPGPTVEPHYISLAPIVDWAGVAEHLESRGDVPLTCVAFASALYAGLRGAS